MIEFLDGPALACKGLCIRRAPLYLRATCKEGRGGTMATGEWDALDQLHDEVEPNETVYCYRLVENKGSIHLRRAKPHTSGMFVMAAYRFVDPQPEDRVLRQNASWQQWATEQVGSES